MLLATPMTVTCSPLSSDPSFPSADIGVDVFDHGCSRSPSPSVSSDEDEDEDEHNLRVAPHWQAYRHLFESHGYRLDTYKDVRQFYLRYWESRNIQQSIQSCAGYRSACREGKDDNELCKDEGLVSFSHWTHPVPPCSPIGGFVFDRCRPWPRSSSFDQLSKHVFARLITLSFPQCILHHLLQPERLFRGKRLLDGLPIVIKAVHRQSRELEVITALSTPPLRDDPMNHCIRESIR